MQFEIPEDLKKPLVEIFNYFVVAEVIPKMVKISHSESRHIAGNAGYHSISDFF